MFVSVVRFTLFLFVVAQRRSTLWVSVVSERDMFFFLDLFDVFEVFYGSFLVGFEHAFLCYLFWFAC